MAWFSSKPKLSSTRNEILDLKNSFKFLSELTFRIDDRVLDLEKKAPNKWILSDIARLTQQVEDLLHILDEAGIIERDTDLVVESANGTVWRSKNAE